MNSPACTKRFGEGGEFGEIKDTSNSKLNDGGKKWLKKNSIKIW
jgi:hypothetical protein